METLRKQLDFGSKFVYFREEMFVFFSLQEPSRLIEHIGNERSILSKSNSFFTSHPACQMLAAAGLCCVWRDVLSSDYTHHGCHQGTHQWAHRMDTFQIAFVLCIF